MSKLPNKKEQQVLLQESSNRTGLFQLQVQELAKQMDTGKAWKKKTIIPWVEKLQDDLTENSLPSTMSKKKLDGSWLKKQRFSSLLSLESAKHGRDVHVEFSPPTADQLKPLGSFHAGSAAATAPHVSYDIGIEMPAEMFQARDILDHQYFDKRKLYLAGICATLQRCGYSLTLALFKADSRKPILQITPPADCLRKGASSNNLVVRLIPMAPLTVDFKLNQLNPHKNNVRPEFWHETIKSNKAKGIADSALDPSALSPTPLYNSAILEDMCLLTHHQLIDRVLSPYRSCQLLVCLFKVWLTKLGLRFTPDGFDSHQATLLVAYLVQTKRINPTAIDADENQSLDSVSVDVVPAFQTLLAFLADVDLCNSALNFTVASISSRVKEFESGKVDCHWHDRGMLLHPIKNRSNGSVVNHNAFWRISNSCLSQLQEEARQSLLELQLRPNTCFQRLFIEDKFFFQRYDYYFHVPALIDNITVAQDLGNVLLHCEAREYVSSIGSILLEQALGDRVRAIHSFVRYVDDSAKEALIASTSHLPSCDLVDSPKGSWIVTFGVSVDPERGFRRVERADQVKLIPRSSIVVDGCLKVASVVDFQAFWGERCQLRRFQDGTITEAVFWDDESLSIKDEIKASASADAITERIVQYTFTRHLIGIVEGSVSRVVAANSTLLESVMKPFDGLTQNSYKVTKPSAGAVSVSEDLTRKAVESLDRLRSLLTSSLSSLPLSFDTIAAVSPELRYTALVPAAPHPVVLCSSQSESSEIRTIWRAYAGQTVSLVVKPVVVLAKLESSGKWPFHAAAIQRLKLAILLQARKELSKKHNVDSVVHSERAGNTSYLHQAAPCLDILFEGLVFRLVPFAGDEVESTVFQKAIGGACLADDIDDNAESGRKRSLEEMQTESDQQRYSAIVAMQHVIREYIVPPLHHNAIRNMHSRFPSTYCTTVRLMSIWIQQHCFTGHISQELLELLVSYVFLEPLSARVPLSPLQALAHTLRLLAEFDWENEPMLVDFSPVEITTECSSMDKDLRADIAKKFQSAREINLSSAYAGDTIQDRLKHKQRAEMNVSMFVVASYDKVFGYWPSLSAICCPEKVVLRMIVKQAAATAKQLISFFSSENIVELASRKGMSSKEIDIRREEEIKSILGIASDKSDNRSPLSICNSWLTFHKGIRSSHPGEGPKFASLKVFANMSSKDYSVNSLVVRESLASSLNPLQDEIVQKLREKFGTSCILFWNGAKGKEVGVVWRPSLLQRKNFSILHSQYLKLVSDGKNEEDSSVEPNVEEIIAHMLLTGEGLLIDSKFNN